VLTGLGLGLLSSLAVTLAESLSDVSAIGTDVIRIAFRLGTYVYSVSQNLEPADQEDKSEPWAYVVHGVGYEEALKELNAIQQREVSGQFLS
jgi:hypothetical protein